MYAVVEIANKQFTVQEGAIITVNRLPAAQGASTVKSDKVLAVFTPDGATVEVGMPYVAGRTVEFTVLESDGQDDKVSGAKWKRRKRYLKVFGHRQKITKLQVAKIG